MSKDKTFENVVNEHQGAMRIFKDTYSFEVKQSDIVFYLRTRLTKYRAEQISDQKKVDALNKKIAKIQPIIDKLTSQLEITQSVTESDVITKGEES